MKYRFSSSSKKTNNIEKSYKIRKAIKDIETTGITGINTTGLTSIFDNLSSSTYMGAPKPFNPSVKTNEEAVTGLKKLYDNKFFSSVSGMSAMRLKKNQTGKELMNVAVNRAVSGSNYYLDTSITNVKSQIDNLTEALKNGKGFMAFDTETIGGNLSTGHQTFDQLLEYAFQKYDKSGKKIGTEITSLIGISQKQADEYLSQLEEIANKRPSDRSTYEKVLFERLSLLGNPETNITEINRDGIAKGSLFRMSSAPDEITGNLEHAKEGLKRSVEIHKKQMKAAGGDISQTQWVKDIQNMASQMNKGETPFMAYNSRFDIDVINQTLARYGTETIDNTHNNIIDPFQMNKVLAGVKGRNYIYRKDGSLKHGLGLTTQEQWARHFAPEVYDNSIAHIATTDIHAMAIAMTKKVTLGGKETTFVDEFKRVVGEAHKEATKITTPYTGSNKQLFFMNQTAMYNNFNRNNALSFIYDPLSKSYKTFDGFEVGSKGASTHTFGQTGHKSKGLYTLDVQKMNMEKYKDMIMNDPILSKQYGDIAANSKYIAIMTPVDLKTQNKTLSQRQIFQFLNTSDDVSKLLSTGNIVANWVGPNNAPTMDNMNIKDHWHKTKELETIKIVKGVDDGLKESVATLDDLAEMSFQKFHNDAGARKLRELNYDKFGLFQARRNVLSKQYGSVAEVAKKISSGTIGDPIFEIPEVYKAFQYNKDGKKIATESLMHVINTDEFYSSMEPVYQSVYKSVKQATANMSATPTRKLRRNILFQEGVANVLRQMTSQYQGNYASPVLTTAASMNKLQLKVGGILPNANPDDILNINLSSSKNLLNSAYRLSGMSGDLLDVNKAGGYKGLKLLHGAIPNMPGFEGVFDHINPKEYTNSPMELLSESMTNALKTRVLEKRKSDFMFGRINVTNVFQDATQANLLVDQFKDQLDEMTKTGLKDIKKLNILNVNTNEGAVLDRVLKHLDQVNMTDFNKSIKILDPKMRGYLNQTHTQAKGEIRDMLVDVVKGVREGGLHIGIDDDYKEGIKLIQPGGKVTRLKLPTLKNYNQNISIGIGRNKYTLNPYLDAYDFAKTFKKGSTPDWSKLRTTTNIRAGSKGTMGSATAVKRAIERGESPAAALEYAMGKKMLGIAEKSSLIQQFTAKTFRSQFEADLNELSLVLPELMEDEMFLSSMKKQAVKTKMPGVPRHIEQFQMGLRRFAKNQGKKELYDRVGSIANMSTKERNVLTLNMQSIMQSLAKHKQPESYSNTVMNNIGYSLRDKRLTEGKYGVFNHWSGTMGASNNQTKTTPFQHDNRIMRSREAIEQHMKYLKGASFDSVVTDTIEKNLLTNVIDGPSGLKLASGLVLNVGAVSENSYANLINSPTALTSMEKAINNIITDPSVDKKQVVANLKQMLQTGNLHEQGGLMNPRAYDIAYSNEQFKTLIHDRRKLFVSSKDQAAKLAYTFNGENFSSGKGFLVNPNTKGLGMIEIGEDLPDELLKDYSKKGFRTQKEAAEWAMKNNIAIKQDSFYGKNFKSLVQGKFITEGGTIATDSEITKLLKEGGMKAGADSAEIEKFLRTKGITYNVISQYADVVGGNKFFMGAEKGTYSAMIPRIGQINPQIAQQLEGTGFENLIGQRLERRGLEAYFDEMAGSLSSTKLDSIKKTIFSERYIAEDVLFKGLLKDEVNVLFNPGMAGHAHGGDVFKMLMETYRSNGGEFSDDVLSKIFGKDAELVKKTKSGLEIKEGVQKRFADLSINVSALKELVGEEYTPLKVGELEVGKIVRDTVSNVHDDIAGGFSSKARDYNKIDNINQEVTRLKDLLNHPETDSPEFKEEIKEQIEKLTAERTAISTRIRETASQSKGMKVTEISRLALGREKWTPEKVAKMNKAMSATMSPTELAEFARHSRAMEFVDGKLQLKEGKAGSKMLQGYLDNLLDIMQFGQGEDTVGDLIKRGRGSEYKDLITRLGSKAHNFTESYASHLTSFGLGANALAFNEGSGSLGRKGLEGLGFKQRHILEIQPDVNQLAGALEDYEDNIYRQSTLLDLGEEFGQEQYFALEKLPTKIHDDRYVKPDHYKSLAALKSEYKNYKNLGDLDEKSAAMHRIKSIRARMVKEQQAYLSGKKSTMAEEIFGTRLDDSFRGKATGKYVTEGVEDMSLNTAMVSIPGSKSAKSLAEWRAQGVYHDASWLSTETFSNLGYFDESYIEKTLGSGATKEQMMEHLKTKGTLMIGTRQPEIREGSILPQRVFLNETLEGNMISLLDITAKAKNADHDGDQIAMAKIAFQDHKRKITYEEYLAGAEMSEKARAYFGEIEGAMTYRAHTINKGYYDITQGMLQDDEKAVGGFFKTLLGEGDDAGVALGNILYSSRYGIDKNISEIDEDFKRVSKYVEEAGNIQQAAQVIMNEAPQEEQEELLRSLAATYNYQRQSMEVPSKIYMGGIGEASVVNRNLKELHENLVKHGTSEGGIGADIFQAVVYEAEEASIGAKKLSSIAADEESLARAIAPDVVERWNTNIQSYLRDPSDETAREEITQWIDDRIKKGIEGRQRSYFEARGLGSLSTEEVTESFFKELDLISANLPGDDFKINKLGTGSIGATGQHLVDGLYLDGTDTFAERTIKTGTEAQYLHPTFKQPGTMAGTLLDTAELDSRMALRAAPSTTDILGHYMADAAETFAGALRNVGGHGLALGALGIAGSVMAAGYIGGSPVPVRPEPEPEETPDLYDQPYLSDQPISMTQQGNRGYIINVNAKTNKGTQEVQQLLNQAIRQNTSTNVNVMMNVDNQYGNINNRDIEDMFRGML